MHEELILGAGPSGLSCSLLKKEKTLILEKLSSPGGHASTFIISGFTFDYGPHILFSKDKEILNFIIKSLENNIEECKRNNKISFKKKLVKYPFENDLGSLSKEDNFACISGFLFNKHSNNEKPRNMKEWFLKHFGEGICEKYLFPYNKKVWNIEVEKLSMQWSERIPKPEKIDILKSSIGIETEGYTHQLFYHYPKKGGYQAISEKWAEACDIKYNEEVIKIKKEKIGYTIITNKQTYESKKIISTINLNSLIKACVDWIPEEIIDISKKLIINPMYVISIGIKGKDIEKYTAIYFPEEEFLVNRISFPGTFAKNNCPENCYSIQAEITFSNKSETSLLTDKEIINHVVTGLEDRGFIERHIKHILYEARKRSTYLLSPKGMRAYHILKARKNALPTVQ